MRPQPTRATRRFSPAARVVLTAGLFLPFGTFSPQSAHGYSPVAAPAPAQSFAYLGGVLEGQDILQALLQNQAWQPGLILALTDDALTGAAGGRPWPTSFGTTPVVK